MCRINFRPESGYQGSNLNPLVRISYIIAWVLSFYEKNTDHQPKAAFSKQNKTPLLESGNSKSGVLLVKKFLIFFGFKSETKQVKTTPVQTVQNDKYQRSEQTIEFARRQV